MNPSITQKERIISLDIIRGIALLGILFINVGAFKIVIEGGPMPNYSGINGVIDILIDIFIEKKFFSIFSFLFGIGFYIFASRAESRGDKPRLRFFRRLMALLLLGIMHIFIFWGSILAIYAIIGLFLIPFYHAKISIIGKWLGVIISLHIISNLIMLYVSDIGILTNIIAFLANDVIAIFIMFLSGFLAAKAEWIRHISKWSKQIKWIQAGTLPLFIGFSIWIWFSSQAKSQSLDTIISLGVLPTTLFYLSTLFLILENKLIAKFLQPIARVGQMAFTNYVAQSIIGLVIISVLGLEAVSPNDIIIISVLIYALQIIFSVIWFKYFKMGPLEKVWRFMTYGRMSNLKSS